MSTVSAKRTTAILVMLVLATVAILAIEVIWMTPAEGLVPVALVTTLIGVVTATLWGATTLGLAALWTAISEKPLLHPITAFGVGVVAFVGMQALAAIAYQNYKTLPRIDGNAVNSESQNNTRRN